MVNCRKSATIDHQEIVPSIVRDVLINQEELKWKDYL